MKFDTEYIEKLADIIADKGLTEISLEDGNQAITIRKELYTGTVSAVLPQGAVQSAATAPSAQSTAPKTEVKKGQPVTSPMVGTFYK